jgi:hypothetical protein
MMRLRICTLAVIAGISLGAVSVPAAGAATDNGASPQTTRAPALYTMPIQGEAKNGKKFTGTYAIHGFVVKGGKAYSIGTLKGKLKNRRVTRGNVMMPASLRPESAPVPGVRAAQTVCPVLELVIGPIDLNLLGLRVQLGGPDNQGRLTRPIVLRITAIEGGGLLGDLLCGLTGALNQPGALDLLNQNLQQLTAALNSLLSLFGGQQATATKP